MKSVGDSIIMLVVPQDVDFALPQPTAGG